MSQQIQDLARWKTISQGQCAFRSSNSQTGSLRCKHLFTNTSECHFIGCPIIQPNYVAIQRSADTIFLVTKDAKASNISEVWNDQELPVDKKEATKVVNKSISGLNETLQEAIKQKFEHLYAVSSVIRESVKESDLDSDLDDLDDLESEE